MAKKDITIFNANYINRFQTIYSFIILIIVAVGVCLLPFSFGKKILSSEEIRTIHIWYGSKK